MHYPFCKHRVVDYAAWQRVFDADAAAQRAAGLHLLHVLRGATDPNLVVTLFRVDDPGKARAFTEAPTAAEHADSSGVIGVPEISWLTEG